MPFDPRVLQHAPWSVSKSDALSRCTHLYQLKYILKAKEESKHSASKLGTAAHQVLEIALTQPGSDLGELAKSASETFGLVTEEERELNTKLPAISGFVTRIRKFKAEQGVTAEFLEAKVAIDANYKSVGFFDRRVLLRGVMDQIIITDKKIAVIIDHKTGRKKRIAEHSTQFFAYMLMAAANYDIVGAQCAINYVGTDAVDWFPKSNGDHGVWSLDDIRRLRGWLEAYLNQNSRSLGVLEDLGPEEAAPTNPNILCGWCGYLNRCEPGRASVEARKKTKSNNDDL